MAPQNPCVAHAGVCASQAFQVGLDDVVVLSRVGKPAIGKATGQYYAIGTDKLFDASASKPKLYFLALATEDRVLQTLSVVETVLPVIHQTLIKQAEGFYAEGVPPPGEMEKLVQKLLDECEGKAEGTVYKPSHLELTS